MAKKVVVTGGAGFIGSHLAEELARRGYYTIILDDLSSPRHSEPFASCHSEGEKRPKNLAQDKLREESQG